MIEWDDLKPYVFIKHNNFMDVCFRIISMDETTIKGYWYNMSQSGGSYKIQMGYIPTERVTRSLEDWMGYSNIDMPINLRIVNWERILNV